MATAGRPRSSALDPATRQQLDELDLLMQRMLALPVDPPEDSATSPSQLPPDPAVPDNTISDQPASRTTVPETGSAAVETCMPVGSYLGDEAKQPAPGLRDGTQTHPLSRDFAASAPAPPANPVPRSPLSLRPAWPLRPLMWINLAFDWSTGWLGPLGGWLREPGGRAVIGWGGLLLLAAALAWLAWDAWDGIGWTW